MTVRVSESPPEGTATATVTAAYEPLLTPPRERLFRCAEQVGTPALLYDLPGIDDTVRRMREDIGTIPGAALNIALKACHTPAVLAHLAAAGTGCDVASPGELDLALAAGFGEITATGPAFSAEDFARLREHGIVPDVDSLSQLDVYGSRFSGDEVGLRIRVPLPKELESQATFAGDSRFGVSATNGELAGQLRRHALRVTRLHTHTGQMTPESLLFKARYLLRVAEHYRDVHTIDFGGGFFHLYVERARAVTAFCRLAGWVAEWRQRTGRELALRFEPGGAVLAAHGYLVAEVRAVEDHHPFFGCRLVTVNASAWNLAPWHKPQAVPLYAPDGPAEPVLVAGNTLYENDFFGRGVNGEQHPITLPRPTPGDRVLLTAAGAYTMTNARWFNRIPPPREYLFDGQDLTATATASVTAASPDS
jgi:diaminopimelate decarboxylase